MKITKLLKRAVIAVAVVYFSFMIISHFKPFKIEGQWSTVGNSHEVIAVRSEHDTEPIIFFNGSNCNFVSPFETYSFQKIKGKYFLTVSSLASNKVTFMVNVIDNDHIEISGSGDVIELERIT